MSDDKKQLTGSDILRSLHELLQEPEQDIAAMPLKDVQAELTRRGIDTAPMLTRIKQRLAKIGAEQELLAAQKQRESVLRHMKSFQNKLSGIPAELRERILSTLGNLTVNNPNVAAAYFSKFEEASDADLQSLLNDLSLLDEFKDDKDSSNGT